MCWPALRRAHRSGAGADRLRGRNPDAEHSLLDLGRAKLQRKGCDLLVLNEVGHGLVFGQPNSAITLLTAAGVGPTITGSKDTLAHRIWDAALGLRVAR